MSEKTNTQKGTKSESAYNPQELSRLVNNILRLKDIPKLSGFAETVMISIMKRYGKHSMEINDIALDLGKTIEFISIELKLEGTNFSELRKFVRIHFSVNHLMDGMPIEDISLQLGFLEQKYFCESFERWTGLTPGKFGEHYQRVKNKKTATV